MNESIRILGPGDEARLEAFLLPRIASSMFLLGNMRTSGLQDGSRPYQGSYAALLDGREIAGVVAHYWNGNLVFQAAGNENALWRAAVAASQRTVAGLIGPSDQVAVAKQALDIAEHGVQMDEVEKLYSLNLDAMIVPDALSAGRVSARRSAPGDVELLTAWRVAFSVESLGAHEEPELWAKTRDSVMRYQEEGLTWVLEDAGEPVACSSFNAATKEAVQIGGVWTPPELRRRGYGRCVVAASLLDAQAEGVEKAILFTAETNTAAQKAYSALGFRHIGDYQIVLLQPPVVVT